MFPRKSSKVALTLLCLVVALGLATVSEANAFVNTPRDHTQLNRMIKRRTPAANDSLPLLGFVGAAGDPSTSTSASSTGTGTGTSSSTGIATDTTTGPSSQTTSALTNTDTALTGATDTTSSGTDTTSGALSSTSVTDTAATNSTSTSTTSTSTSTSASSTSTSTTSSTPLPSTDNAAPADTQQAQSSSTHTATFTNVVTQTAAASDPSSTAGASVSGATSSSSGKITRTTLTVIIVIAVSIGVIALGWTLFRKWKLRPSSSFDDRMQPIDWAPSPSESHESGIPGLERRGSHGSFHSAGHSNDGNGYGVTSNRGSDPLEHDFTAGPATLAPSYVGGYTDLQRGPSVMQRGPSPQPNMTQLHRGPSFGNAGYAEPYDYNARY